MSLSTTLGKKSARGSFHLFLGIVTQNVILAVGAIIIGRLLGSALYGLYTLSSIPANFMGLFVGFGIRNATIRYTAQYSHHEQQKKVKETILAELSFIAVMGGLLTILAFSLAGPIVTIFGRPDAELLVQIMSLTILFNALIVASQSIFVGLERTKFYSFILILRAVLQTTLQPVLILQFWSSSNFDALGAVVGYAVASLVTCAVGLSISYTFIIRRLSASVTRSELLGSFRRMLLYGFPLYISTILGGFLTQFLSLLMAIYASNTLIGNYQVSLNFTVLISFFATPIATVLFPAFSKLSFREDPEPLRDTFRTSVKYTSLLVIPATALVVVLSKPLVSTLYGSDYETAPLFLSLTALAFLYSGLGQFSIPAILNGQGETKKTMFLGIANVTLGLSLAAVLVPRLQIIGVIVTTLVANLPQVILGSIWIRRLYNASTDFEVTAKTLLTSAASGLAAWGAVNLLNLPNWAQLIVGATVLPATFVVLAPLTETINSKDIQNLRTIFSETGPALTILSIPLRIMSRLCKHSSKPPVAPT